MRKVKTNIALIGHLFALGVLLGCADNDTNNLNIPEPETIIVNLTTEEYDVYIGRGIEYHTHMLAESIKPGEEGWLGNPHPIGWCDRCQVYHTRDECIEKFKSDFYKKVESDLVF